MEDSLCLLASELVKPPITMTHARLLIIALLVATLGSSHADAGVTKWLAKALGRKLALSAKKE